MPYETSGTLTTDKRTVNDTSTWDSQAEWEAYQSISNVEINSGAVELKFNDTIDNFEAALYEDLTRTLSDYYNDVGNTAALTFQRQQATVLEGSYSMELVGNDSGATVISTGTSDLPYTPVQGDTFRVKLRGAQTSTFASFLYGVQDSSNYYEILLDIPNDTIELHKDGAEQASTAATLSQNTTYDPELDWAGDGTQTLTLTDDGSTEQSVSFTDTEYTSGEIGFIAGRTDFVDPSIFADDARVI